jgi:hypothetical protein
MRPREGHLIKEFLAHMNAERGTDFAFSYSPEDVGGGEPPIEAIAVNSRGDRLAIEHTLLETFLGERTDNDRFLKALAPLEHDADLLIDGYDISMTFKVGAIPTGVDWSSIAPKLKAWCRQTFGQLGEDTVTTHQVPNIGFPLEVTIDKSWIGEDSAYVFVGRWLPENKPFADVVKKAVAAKLPKLLATNAAGRVLLVEKNALPHSAGSIGIALDSLSSAYPDLKKIAVWMVDTVALETTGRVRVKRVR